TPFMVHEINAGVSQCRKAFRLYHADSERAPFARVELEPSLESPSHLMGAKPRRQIAADIRHFLRPKGSPRPQLRQQVSPVPANWRLVAMRAFQPHEYQVRLLATLGRWRCGFHSSCK